MRASLYDADGNDRSVGLSELAALDLSATTLLWVDVDSSNEEEIAAVSDVFHLDEATSAALGEGSGTPSLVLHREYLEVRVTALAGSESGYDAVELDCVAGSNWVLTSHARPLSFLERFDDRFRGESNVGQLSGSAFLATLLGEQLQTYDRQLMLIVNRIDELDRLVLRDRIGEDRVLRELLALNQENARLYRWLAPHDDVFERLAQPHFAQLTADDDAQPAIFAPLNERYQRILASMDSDRQMVANSLQLYTTLVAHSTNKVITLLTVTSVTLLPPTLMAGVLGMDSLPNGLRTTTAFWISLSAMLVLVTATLTLARRRHWI